MFTHDCFYCYFNDNSPAMYEEAIIVHIETHANLAKREHIHLSEDPSGYKL